MLIQQAEEGGKGKFYVEIDGKILAEMVYHISADHKMVIEHTEVSDELAGKRVGNALVNSGVEYARTKGMKIIPWCPFAKAILTRKPEFADVLDKEGS